MSQADRDPQPALARRVEEASLNAWPAMQQLILDGWVLRFARGFTKRANSVVPLYPSRLPAAEKIRYCENLYARERLTTTFRLTSILDNLSLDEALAARGYERVDPTLVMSCALNPSTFSTDARVREVTQAEWLKLYASFADLPAAAQALHAALLSGIRTDRQFAVLTEGGAPRACGLAVTDYELTGLFDVITHPDSRGRGFGEALVRSQLAWAAEQGAACAYLQVVENNVPARRLYDRLGFKLLYRYWYRTAP